jgi:hypothetical protein
MSAMALGAKLELQPAPPTPQQVYLFVAHASPTRAATDSTTRTMT